MEIGAKPRIIIWFVTNDGRYINAAMNILAMQHSGVEVVGVTAMEKISINNLPFIPLNEISMNGGGGMTSFLLPAQDPSACRKL